MKLLKGEYGVCKLDSDSKIPSWSTKGDFFNITKTNDELSLVCDATFVPEGVVCEKDWKVLKILGPLDFALVGILSSISTVLAENGISIFAISTYDTDYILVKEKNLEKTITCLREANYEIF
jgi:hypothetical protein